MSAASGAAPEGTAPEGTAPEGTAPAQTWPAGSGYPPLDDLPEPARGRVVALTAELLPQVTPLPPSLRRVADFAPGRRARLGSRPIAAALEDDDFRSRVGIQAAALLPDLARSLGEGSVDAVDAGDGPDAEPVEVVALAWLRRGDGCERALAVAAANLLDRQRQTDLRRAGVEADRLRAALAEAEAGTRDTRERLRSQLDAGKGENATLRRKLADSRARHREAVAGAERVRDEAAEAVAAALAGSAAQEAEIRRLRSRAAAAEAAAGAVRRDARSERDDTALRARVLLDAVLEAAQGLRRELALPAVDGAPGDRVEAGLVPAADADAPTGGGPDAVTPARLDGYLLAPRARLLVDGYNVTKAGWPDASLETQRSRLLGALAPLVARSGAETTVVFDAQATRARPPVHPPRGVKVVFSPFGVLADDVLGELVAAEPRGRMVVVVSNDREVRDHARRAGARPVPSESLLGLLER